MRFYIPLVLLGATVMAEETAQDVLSQAIPTCLQSCLGKAIGGIFGCSLDDSECLCNADTPSADETNGLMDKSNQCVQQSNCTKADIQKLASVDFNKLWTQGTQEICNDGVTLSATNAVFAVGTMAFLAFL